MPFDWMHPTLPKEIRAQEASRAAEMYARETEERAALLQRLGYDKDSARTRLRANARWDWEGSGRAKVAAKVDEVDEAIGRVFARRAPPDRMK